MGLFEREPGYWKKRAKMPRRPKLLKSPSVLWDLACDYFEYVDSTPVTVNEVLRGGDRAGEIVSNTVARPYTWYGLSDYLWAKGITSVLDDYRYNREGRYDEYREVIARVSEVMREQKFTGATAGVYKERIIMAEFNGELEKAKAAASTEDTSITINIVK